MSAGKRAFLTPFCYCTTLSFPGLFHRVWIFSAIMYCWWCQMLQYTRCTMPVTTNTTKCLFASKYPQFMKSDLYLKRTFRLPSEAVSPYNAIGQIDPASPNHHCWKHSRGFLSGIFILANYGATNRTDLGARWRSEICRETTVTTRRPDVVRQRTSHRSALLLYT